MLLKLSKIFLCASLFSVVVVMTSTFFPFIGGKYYFFRVMVEAALICFLLWWAFQAHPGAAEDMFKRTVSHPIFIAVSVFVLAFLLATLFANNSYGAFWSNYERGEGGFQMIHYYVFFVLFAMLFREWREWRWVFWSSIAAAALMVAYGMLGYLSLVNPAFKFINFITPYQGGTLPDGFWNILTIGRFQGSLGNPAYVAPYLMFTLFYVFYLWTRIKPENKNKKIFFSVLYGVIAIIFLFFFAVSQTRGAFFGLVAATITFLTYLGFFAKRIRLILLGTLGSLLCLGASLIWFHESAFVHALPGGRFFEITMSGKVLLGAVFGILLLSAAIMFMAEKRYRKYAFSMIVIMVLAVAILGGTGRLHLFDETMQTRLWTWGSAWHGFLERPVLGWGPENFSTVFDKYFNPRHFIPGTNSETWFDRAHSVIFDYLAETGVVGVLSYLGIFGVFFYLFFSKQRAKHFSEKTHGQAVRGGLLLALPIGHLVQGLALFDVLPIYINLFLFLAFSVFVFSCQDEVRQAHER